MRAVQAAMSENMERHRSEISTAFDKIPIKVRALARAANTDYHKTRKFILGSADGSPELIRALREALGLDKVTGQNIAV